MIHDTKELRLRANSHAKYDHVKQGTYGNAKANGKVEYQGCAVGCLAIPHRQSELRAFIIEHGKYDAEDGYYYADFSGPKQQKRVYEQFGIPISLQFIAEGFFEGQTTHGAAIEFVKAFAHSLNEGAVFTEEMIDKWTHEHFELRIRDWEEVKDFYRYSDPGTLEAGADEFLMWCKSVKPSS